MYPTAVLRQDAREAGMKREAVRTVVIEEGWRSLPRVKVPFVLADGHCRRRRLVNSLDKSLFSNKKCD